MDEVDAGYQRWRPIGRGKPEEESAVKKCKKP
jgi:hypothetical protein